MGHGPEGGGKTFQDFWRYRSLTWASAFLERLDDPRPTQPPGADEESGADAAVS